MIDPFADVVGLLRPTARFSKIVNAAGRWGVRRGEAGQAFYCAVLAGSCRLAVDGRASLVLEVGDFVLIPAAYDFTMSSIAPAVPEDFDLLPVALDRGEYGLGAEGEPADVRLLVGHCVFASPDAALLVALLPQLVHVRGARRLATLVQLVGDESRATRPAREVVLARLLEVLLIEALRCTADPAPPPGLLRGLADPRLAGAIRRMHEHPDRRWTVGQLAREAALSRSTFFTRFSLAVGVTPVAYLLAWRMALAKTLLAREGRSVAEVAARVGYGSASSFSVAFTRFVGCPPTRYAREPALAAAG